MINYFIAIYIIHQIQLNNKIILEINFDDLNIYTYPFIYDRNLTLVKTKHNNSKGLRVEYKPSFSGSQRVQQQFFLDKPVKSATLNFYACFETNFDWAKGGKLHGLSSFIPTSGGDFTRSDRWSSRLLFKPQGSLQNYIYEQQKKTKFGFGSKSKKNILPKNKWVNITLQIKLNHSDDVLGFANVFVNNELVISNNNIQFRKIYNAHTLISKFIFSTFHGGNDTSFSPKIDGVISSVFAYYDDIVVYQGIILPKINLVNSNTCI